MVPIPLTVEQEVEAQRLAQRLEAEVRAELLALARLLVSKRESETFGETEFQARAVVHRIGAKAIEVHLAEKKTAIGVPASSVPIVSKPLSSRTIGKKRR